MRISHTLTDDVQIKSCMAVFVNVANNYLVMIKKLTLEIFEAVLAVSNHVNL